MTSFRNTAIILPVTVDAPHELDEDVFERALIGLLPQRLDGSLSEDPPLLDDRDLVADALRLGHDVRRVNHGPPLLLQLLNQAQDGPGADHVEPRGRIA